MNCIRIRDLIIIYGVIFIFVVAFLFIPFMLYDKGTNSVVIPSSDFSDGSRDLTHRLRDVDEPIVKTYTVEVSKESLLSLLGKRPQIIITRLEAQGYTILWNDHMIGFAGDVEKGNANIWNSSHKFNIPEEFIQDQNTLELVVHSKYDVGMFHDSIQIGCAKDIEKLHNRFTYVSEQLTVMSLGATLFTLIISTVMLVLNSKKREGITSMMLAILVFAISTLDFLTFDTLVISYLAFKKVIMLTMFLTPITFGFYISSFTHRKSPINISFVIFIIFAIGTALCSNMLIFKKFYNIAFFMMPLCIAYFMFVLIPMLKVDNDARILFGGSLVLIVITLWEVIVNIVAPSFLCTSPLPYVLVLATMLILLIASETILRNIQLEDEIVQKNELYKKSITDKLTGIYSRQYCDHLISESMLPYSVAMLDIDKFKNINDTYGHTFGDEVIKVIAQTMTESIRENDYIGRYGGDEFILVLRCPKGRALQVCKRVNDSVRNTYIEHGNEKINVTVSIGLCNAEKIISTRQLIEHADMALYKAKQRGRDCIVICDS